jgi:hypothetical protein
VLAQFWLLLAIVAKPTHLDTGQFTTYLFFSFLPIIILILIHVAGPTNPVAHCYLMTGILRGTPWHLQGVGGLTLWLCCKSRKKLKKPIRHYTADNVPTTTKLIRTYLVPVAIASFQVGCCIKRFICRSRCQTPLPATVACPVTFHATNNNSHIQFDSDSFAMGVNNHALYCMVNSPHLFKNLTLTKDTRQIQGINEGLAIEGGGTFKFTITDDSGQCHTIRIPNSLYLLPKLEECLMLPQHWAQEAGDNQTWMNNFVHCCVLHWGNGFKKTIPFDTASNTLTFYTALLSKAYRVFTTTYEAFNAAFFCCETVLQVPGLQAPRKAAELDPSKFVAVENLNLRQKKWEENLTDSAVTEDNETVKTSNVPPDPQEVTKPAAPEETICRGPLTFNPNVQADDTKDTLLAAPDNQAELMHWHYRLGHLSFTTLKQLAHNGKIAKKLAKVTPPQVRGMPLWCDDQASLARQREQVLSRGLCCNQAGGDGLSQPNGINRSQILCPAQGYTQQKAL